MNIFVRGGSVRQAGDRGKAGGAVLLDAGEQLRMSPKPQHLYPKVASLI